MNLYDPLRPRLANGAPAYASEKLCGALPTFQVSPQAEGTVRVMVFLPSGPYRYAPRTIELKIRDLPDLLGAFEEDPEGCLERTFGWSLRAAEEASSKPQPSGLRPPPGPPQGKTEDSAEDLGF